MTQNTRVITQTEFSLDVSYKVFYSTKDPVPIDEMVSALLAIERILKRAPRVFSAVTGVPIEKLRSMFKRLFLVVSLKILS